MNIGSILIVLVLSILLVAYITHPLQAREEDFGEEQAVRMDALDNNAIEPEFCSNCGHRLNQGDRFCAQCGKSVEPSN